MKKTTRNVWPLGAPRSIALMLVALACVSGDGRPPKHTPEYAIGSVGQPLVQPDSCEVLADAMQRDALARVETQTQRHLDEHAWDWDMGGFSGGCGMAMSSSDPMAMPGSNPQEQQSNDLEYSETNVQVEGVDEADIVKTDGERIYAVSNGMLHVVRSWPAEQLDIQARVAIEGEPLELFVHDGKAVVFSGTNDPRDPDPSPQCHDVIGDWGNVTSVCDAYTFTKITVLNLNLDTPEVTQEQYVRGAYHSARRHDDLVRVVVGMNRAAMDFVLPSVHDYLPDLYESTENHRNDLDRNMAAIYEWREAAIKAIKGRAAATDWVLGALQREQDELMVGELDCSNIYLPQPGVAAPGLTQVVGLDLGHPGQALSQTTLWGAPDEIYADHQSLIVAQSDQSASEQAIWSGSAFYGSKTALHRFALNGDGSVTYQDTGLVDGIIVDQFSIDIHDNVVRVATTASDYETAEVRRGLFRTGRGGADTVNQVYALEGDGRGRLKVIGQTKPLAPGEDIRSARFLGDMGYVVTFPTGGMTGCDPLYAIDLSDPKNPTVLGELHIPGFSTYMHPLDDGHLVTIGFTGMDCRGASGLSLKIFDVTDPVNPAVKHQFAFSDWRVSSDAQFEHRALTFYRNSSLLAFPVLNWSPDGHASTLQVFRVSADTGFEKVGFADHSELLGPVCNPDWDSNIGMDPCQIRRGVFVEDYVYSLSEGGVQVHAMSNMSEPLASVPFFVD